MAVSSWFRGCDVCGSSAVSGCLLVSWSASVSSELLALLAEVLLGSLWARRMTQAPLVSVEVVVAGMGAGGVVRNASDKMDAASTAAGLGGVRGRGGVLVVSTPETVVGELAEPLELWHIKRWRRYVFGESCMRGCRAVCGIKEKGQDVPSPVSVNLLSCVCCSAPCPLQIFVVSVAFSEPFSGIPQFGGSSSCIASRIGVLCLF